MVAVSMFTLEFAFTVNVPLISAKAAIGKSAVRTAMAVR